MIHLTPEFVETFTQMACTALQRYPQDRSRLHQACLMVLDGAVTLSENGAALVTSRSMPGRVYQVAEGCQCRGAQHGIARCSHRWAVSLLRHTMAALATAEAHQLPEGGYSIEERDRRAAAGNLVATICNGAVGTVESGYAKDAQQSHAIGYGDRDGGQHVCTANR